MGSSASVALEKELEKPVDASDITSLEQGRNEVQRLRMLLAEAKNEEAKACGGHGQNFAASLSDLEITMDGCSFSKAYAGSYRPHQSRRTSISGGQWGISDILPLRSRGGLLAYDFVAALEAEGNHIDTDAALFIPVEELLLFGSFPSYDIAVARRLHTPGSVVISTSDRVLMVSHRWSTASHPDPEGVTFSIVSDFLKRRGRRMKWVWIDYSCVDTTVTHKDQDSFASILAVALLRSTDLLMVPRVTKKEGHWVSDLTDFTSRSWCQAEALICLVTGTDATLALHCSHSQGEEKASPDAIALTATGCTFFARTDWGADGGKTFFLAGERAAKGMSEPGPVSCWNVIRKEPKENVGVLASLVQTLQEEPLLASRLLCCRMSAEDIKSHPILCPTFGAMGTCSRESDQPLFLGLIFSVLLFLENLSGSTTAISYAEGKKTLQQSTEYLIKLSKEVDEK